MDYQARLNPWVVSKLLPNLKQLSVIRFRRRNDAEAYLRVLKEMQPQGDFAISFDGDTREYAAQAK